jgi:4-amino-4-deoxy-L-arabinose transferase-like glycosyltransferase
LALCLLVLASASTQSRPPTSTPPYLTPGASPTLTLTEDQLRAIISKAVDDSVTEAVRIALVDYSRPMETRVSLWRGAACISTGAALGGLANGSQGMVYGAGLGLISAGIYEFGHRVLGWW